MVKERERRLKFLDSPIRHDIFHACNFRRCQAVSLVVILYLTLKKTAKLEQLSGTGEIRAWS